MRANVKPKKYNFQRFCQWWLGLNLRPNQLIHGINLENLKKNTYEIMEVRQSGVSTLVSAYSIYKCVRKSHTKIALIGRNYAIGQYHCIELMKMLKRIPFEQTRGTSINQISFENGSSISFLSTEDNAARMGRRYDYIFVDSSGDPEEAKRIVWSCYSIAQKVILVHTS